MNQRIKPLVSIIVITYNSSKYVIETLESCRQQSYLNIELIISDDGSSDRTVAICEKWLTENKARFNRVELVTVSANTGIAGNCNRGIFSAKGEWIKLIAGDDVLMPDCIQDNLEYITANHNAQVVHSKRLDYLEYFKDENFFGEYSLESHAFGSEHITPEEQYQVLLREVYVSAPTAFFKRSLLENMKGFDERIPMIEDWPMWLKITSAGYKIHYLNKATVKYRLHPDSASSMTNKTRLFPKTEVLKETVYELYIYPNIPFLEKLLYKYNFKRMKLINVLNLNKGTKTIKLLNKITAYPVSKYRLLKANSILN
jgi:alpha-1,3-rhamnosyltransferase